MAVVGTPAYFAKRPPPQTPQDLAAHDCITLRLPTYDSLYAWELEKDGHEVKVPVQGQLVFNSGTQILKAALAGFGLAYLPADMVQVHLAEGRLTRVLEDWCPAFPGYYLLSKPPSVLAGACLAGQGAAVTGLTWCSEH